MVFWVARVLLHVAGGFFPLFSVSSVIFVQFYALFASFSRRNGSAEAIDDGKYCESQWNSICKCIKRLQYTASISSERVARFSFLAQSKNTD